MMLASEVLFACGLALIVGGSACLARAPATIRLLEERLRMGKMSAAMAAKRKKIITILGVGPLLIGCCLVIVSAFLVYTSRHIR